MTIAPCNTQLTLLPWVPRFQITKNSQARYAYGMVAQEIVCAALRLDPIPINGNFDVCFDAQRGSTFYEIKSCKKTAKTVLYDWRLNKETRSGVEVVYAILLHSVRGSKGPGLFEEMAACGLELLLVPLEKVITLAFKQPLRLLQRPSAKSGYSRKGYIEGYRNVPTRCLKALCPTQTTISTTLYEQTFNVQIYT